jgi:hypothetical protein
MFFKKIALFGKKLVVLSKYGILFIRIIVEAQIDYPTFDQNCFRHVGLDSGCSKLCGILSTLLHFDRIMVKDDNDPAAHNKTLQFTIRARLRPGEPFSGMLFSSHCQTG